MKERAAHASRRTRADSWFVPPKLVSSRTLPVHVVHVAVDVSRDATEFEDCGNML